MNELEELLGLGSLGPTDVERNEGESFADWRARQRRAERDAQLVEQWKRLDHAAKACHADHLVEGSAFIVQPKEPGEIRFGIVKCRDCAALVRWGADQVAHLDWHLRLHESISDAEGAHRRVYG